MSPPEPACRQATHHTTHPRQHRGVGANDEKAWWRSRRLPSQIFEPLVESLGVLVHVLAHVLYAGVVSETPDLWEADHPYYCSGSNYYVGATPKPGRSADDFAPYDHVRFDGWDEFAWKDNDPDLNLLFRWDWYVPEDKGGEERLELFWMLQRWGRFMVTSFPVRREQEPEIRAWLSGRAKTITAIWAPIELAKPPEGAR